MKKESRSKEEILASVREKVRYRLKQRVAKALLMKHVTVNDAINVLSQFITELSKK